jgi:hypothetical protein
VADVDELISRGLVEPARLRELVERSSRTSTAIRPSNRRAFRRALEEHLRARL